MSGFPEGLDRSRHSELSGRAVEPWVRRAILAVFLAVAVLALANVLGQRSGDTTASASGARINLNVPTTVRGGLLFQARIDVFANTAIDHPRLVLDRGWAEGMQLNTIEPAPVGQTSRDGRLVFSYDALKAGDHMTVWVQFQADPTYTGRRALGLELDDAETPVVRLNHTLHVLP